jgi:ribokinase
LAAARAGGVETEILLALGDDAFAAPIEASLNSAGVRLHAVRVKDEPTGTAFICVSDAGENAITVAPGANSCLRGAHLPSLKGVSHLLLQLEIPIETVTAYALLARGQGVKVVLNAAPAQELPPDLLALVDVLVVNEGELNRLARGGSNIAARIAQLSVATIVVTLGDQGCVARINGEFLTQPAYAVDVIDSTAAGDTFCGVLAAALSRNADLQNALIEASAASALACTRLGAQESIPARVDVENLMRDRPATNNVKHTSLRRLCGIAN